MSEADIEELCALFEILKDRYHFRWSQTYNPKWVRALADEMEAEQRCQNG